MHGNEDRGAVCRIERFDPVQKSIIDFAEKLRISEEVKAKATELIRQYCQKVTKETFGGSPKSFAAAAIYIAGILCNERQSQEYIAYNVDVTQVAIRSARDKLRDTLGLKIIL